MVQGKPESSNFILFFNRWPWSHSSHWTHHRTISCLKNIITHIIFIYTQQWTSAFGTVKRSKITHQPETHLVFTSSGEKLKCIFSQQPYLIKKQIWLLYSPLNLLLRQNMFTFQDIQPHIYICIHFFGLSSVYLALCYRPCIAENSVQRRIMHLCAQGHRSPVAWNSRWRWSE